jgi:pyrroline-5-carboxylate reductase
METLLPPATKSVIRAMPNTPCTVGQCAAAIALGSRSQSEDKVICEKIFKSLGTVNEVPENLLGIELAVVLPFYLYYYFIRLLM